MKKTNWITIALMMLVLSAVMPTLTGCKTSALADNGSPFVKYTCQKHPEVVQNSPGNCPVCGMTLVEVVSTASSTVR